VRDPNDRLANSIIAVSGLRLSTRALADLSRQNNLSSSVKTESQELAKLLRESLGEQGILKGGGTQAGSQTGGGRNGANGGGRIGRGGGGAAATGAGAKPKPGAASECSSDTDPFGCLKK
jgi:hypothetical protein